MMLNSVTIEIKSSSLRCVNAMSNEGIPFSNFRRKADKITITLSSKYLPYALSILDKQSISYDIIAKRDVSHIKKDIVSRSGFITGIVLIIVACIILSNLTLDISVRGAKLNDIDKIIDVLAQEDFKVGHIKSTKLKDASSALLTALPNLSYVDMRYEGSRLLVNIVEELPPPQYYKNDKGEIIANYDGIVTRVIVTHGTAMVKAGDSVRRGDILIAPYRIYGEGEEERRVEEPSEGEVYARIYLREDVYIGENNIASIATGNIKCINRVFVDKIPPSPYDKSDVLCTQRRLYSILPLSIKEYKFSEKKDIIYKGDDKNYQELLINNASLLLDTRILEGETLLNKWIFEKRLDNMRIISVYYEVERMISGG